MPSRRIVLHESRAIAQFLPLLREIELGDRFLLSILHWCGIGERSMPLDFWQVYLVRRASKTIGICGLYRQVGMEKPVLWLGWLGIRPQFRRRGFAAETVKLLIALAKRQQVLELWVYTDATNEPAHLLYTQLGFELMGAAAQCAPGKTMNDSDAVFRLLI